MPGSGAFSMRIMMAGSHMFPTDTLFLSGGSWVRAFPWSPVGVLANRWVVALLGQDLLMLDDLSPDGVQLVPVGNGTVPFFEAGDFEAPPTPLCAMCWKETAHSGLWMWTLRRFARW